MIRILILGEYRCRSAPETHCKEDSRKLPQSISMGPEAEDVLVVVLGTEEDFAMPCWTRRR
jgi:hypothetical protein